MSATLLSLAVAVAAPVSEPAGRDRVVLSTWIDAYFARVQNSCQIKLKPKNKGGSVAPADVQEWGVLRPHWTDTVVLEPQVSVDHVFSTVYHRSGNAFTALPAPIGVTWASATGPILYAQASHAQREHNCVTLLTARADAKLGLSVVQIQGALSSAYDTSGTLTSFLYAGTMISPITATLGYNTTVTARPPGVERMSVLLALWDWYRVQPDMIALGEAHQLEILDSIDGVAVQTVSGLTQKALIEGSARLSAGIPFFSASTDTSGKVSGAFSYQLQDFAVARWGSRPRLLPSATEVARAATLEAAFQAAPANVAGIESAEPFQFAFDLPNVPSAYCSTEFWQLATPTNAQVVGAVSTALAGVAPVAGATSTCRFKLDVTPPSKAETGVIVPMTVRSAPLSAVTGGPSLVLTAKPVTIADYRSAFSLEPPTGSRQLLFPVGDQNARTLTLNLPVREAFRNRQAIGLQPGSASIAVTCGRAHYLAPVVTSQFARGDAQASVSMSLTFAPTGLDGMQTCQVGGTVGLRSGGSSAPLTVAIPTFDIVLSAPAAATPPSQN